MKNRPQLVILFLLTVMLVSGCGREAGPVVDYLPLTGAGFTYQMTFHRVDEVYEDEEYRWIFLADYDDYEFGPPADGPLYAFDDLSRNVMYQYLRHDGDSLRFLEFYNNLLLWEELPFWIELPLSAGARWGGEGWSAAVEDAGDVETPYSMFADCLSLTFTIGEADEDGFRQSWTLYLAPEVGPVAEVRWLTPDNGYSALLVDHFPLENGEE